VLRERSFVERRENRWRSLEDLVTLAESRGIARVGADRLDDLGRLYRSVTTDLAVAQSRNYDPEIREYLNRLTARAHAIVYGKSDAGSWARVRDFYARRFPQEVRRSWRPIASCTAVFLAGAIVAYILVAVRPLSAYAILPPDSVPLIKKSLHDSNFAVESGPAMFARLLQNNVQVSALAFAGGMTLGLLTLWVILQNGVLIGAYASLFAAKGFGTDYFVTVAPHGAFELTAIQISGGAGLLLALAIIAPGRRRRSDALRENARRAGVLIVGVITMLLIAAIIEGFFSPLRTPLWARGLVGATMASLLAVYLTFAGREAPLTV
jgi:uncharacterized membrane protein SpoIIM required for sporulation